MPDDVSSFVARSGSCFPADSLIHVALEAAFRAGEILRSAPRDGELEVEEKSHDRGIVTEFDRRSEELISEILMAKTPYGLIGEEEGLHGASGETLWVVDPIDGTTNFSRHIPLSAVSIGLIERGQITLGVVYNPFLDECFSAVHGSGAFLNGRKIQVVPAATKGRPLVFVNSGYAAEFERCAELLSEKLRGHVLHRHFGSTAIEICYVAAGRAEAFSSIGDELWDYAGAVSVATEAGAWVSDWEGKVWSIQRSDIVVAAPTSWPLLEPHVQDTFRSCGLRA